MNLGGCNLEAASHARLSLLTSLQAKVLCAPCATCAFQNNVGMTKMPCFVAPAISTKEILRQAQIFLHGWKMQEITSLNGKISLC